MKNAELTLESLATAHLQGGFMSSSWAVQKLKSCADRNHHHVASCHRPFLPGTSRNCYNPSRSDFNLHTVVRPVLYVTSFCSETKECFPGVASKFIFKRLWIMMSNKCTSVCLLYNVVQIWPGQTVTCLHTNSPGHIWTTLYIQTLLHVSAPLGHLQGVL
jgi:hypothetical protein